MLFLTLAFIVSGCVNVDQSSIGLAAWGRVKETAFDKLSEGDTAGVVIKKLGPPVRLAVVMPVLIYQSEDSPDCLYRVEFDARSKERISEDSFVVRVVALSVGKQKELRVIWPTRKHSEKEPNQALEPTPIAVTHRADARVAPATGVAHL